jgi:PTS system mannose-specific IIB component/fructoselysine and glucoselysine-specific PTS system IIB component
MPTVLYRIDERLIHGQVVVGWGGVLRPDLIVVVDDELHGSSWEQELYTLGLPPEIGAEFYGVAGAREQLDGWRRDRRRIIVLTRDLRTMRLLAAGGLMRGEEVNLGGIHFAPGRQAVLPYLFLDADAREELRRLGDEGVTISARDLPDSRPVDLAELLRKSTDR